MSDRKLPTRNRVQHLALGRVVIHCRGYVDGNYVFDLRHNLGDFFNVNGTGDAGSIRYDLRVEPRTVTLELRENLRALLPDVEAAMDVIDRCWTS